MPDWLKSLCSPRSGASSDYGLHWQYLIAASRMSSALSLATLFSAIAILTKITDLANLGWPALGCFILAVTVYAMAILVIRLRAPAFLQEYSDYKAYDDKKHSHRWILWQFYTSLLTLNAGFKLLHETVEKKLSVDVTTLSPRSYLPVAASFLRPCTKGTASIAHSTGSASIYDMCVHKPLNFDRDLIMGFTMKSRSGGVERRYVLAVQEADEERELKCKELFWIIFTESAKENPKSREYARDLIRVSSVFLFLAILLSILHSILPAVVPTDLMLSYLHNTHVDLASKSFDPALRMCT